MIINVHSFYPVMPSKGGFEVLSPLPEISRTLREMSLTIVKLNSALFWIHVFYTKLTFCLQYGWFLIFCQMRPYMFLKCFLQFLKFPKRSRRGNYEFTNSFSSLLLKFSLPVFLKFSLMFAWFEPHVSYILVSYIKKRVNNLYCYNQGELSCISIWLCATLALQPIYSCCILFNTIFDII